MSETDELPEHATPAADTAAGRLLPLREAAARLHVSTATLRNWIRLGVLLPDRERPYRFRVEAVAAFRREKRSESGARLTSRANKSRSTVRRFRGPCREAAAVFRSLRPGLECAMYTAALKRLEAAGEIELDGIRPVCFLRESVRTVLENWRRRLRQEPGERALRFFEALPAMDGEESLGELHQALTSIGHRAVRGAYYTATGLADDALRFGAGAGRFLDPCCGSGHYLVRAASVLKLGPDRIYGIECDPVAAELARINLLLAFPFDEFTPHIFRGDALAGRILREAYGSFDLVATNPPWEAVRSGREESFALFIRQALRFLGPEGRLSFLLPEAVLNIRAHAPLRRMLFEECRIESVTLLGRCFTGVFTPVVRLDAVNAPPGDGHRFPVVHPDGARELHRQEPGCRDCAIETGISAADRALLDKIDACPHLTLAGNAEWALGIVTGDNAKLLATAPEPGAEPILRGCDIRPNRLKTPQRYLRPGKLQQAAPKRLYRTKPKLVYRFIANRPVCAVDPDGFLTLNSANLLIPHLPGWPAELAARYLNSRLAGYIFMKRFATCKVLRKDLELLPFPPLAAGEADGLMRLGEEELEERFFDKFGLAAEERALISRVFQ